ncbi:MAG: GNAT family N-acetyltransferase [Clostridiaceae bacterium]|nr:GNAT family N-acetyltransferase [Clostridiaceae bacterium]
MKFRLADQGDIDFFIEDYLDRYGSDETLAEKYAIACTKLHRSILLYSDDKIIGAITWSVKEGTKSGLVEIFQMTIPNKENRGKGYGATMLKECLEDIENYYIERSFVLRRVFIVIDEENLAGRNVYKNYSFDIIAEINSHLKPQRKSLIYAKNY